MPDVFISYPSEEAELAQWADWVQGHLAAEGRSVYSALISDQPDERWSTEILANLKQSPWAICLLSSAAAGSSHVQRGLATASRHNKNIIPILLDAERTEMSAWLKDYAPLGLRRATSKGVLADFTRIAARIKADRDTGLSIGAALLGGLIFLLSRRGPDIEEEDE